jgi:hypothetical protein
MDDDSRLVFRFDQYLGYDSVQGIIEQYVREMYKIFQQSYPIPSYASK